MKKKAFNKVLAKTCLCLVILLFLTAAAMSAEKQKGIAGKWKLTVDSDGRQTTNTLSIRKTKEGALTAQWGLGGRESEIKDVKFENNKLSLVRTTSFRDREFSSTLSATYDRKTDKLSGTLSSERGDSDVTATRIIPKPPAVGKWNMRMERGERVIESTLSILQKPDGKLEGKWITERGESEISNIKCVKNKLTFDRVRQFGDRESKTTFEGTVKGHELTGEMTSQRGSTPITGKRLGAEVIGRWELTTVSERGERTSILLIAPDLTAVYGMGFGELNAENLKLDADKLSFTINMGFGDREFSMDYNLKLKGNKLEGQVSTERGDSTVTGRKIVPKPREKPETAEKQTGTKKQD